MRAMRGRGSHPSPRTNWGRVLADADKALEEVAVKHGLRAEVVRRKYNMSCLHFVVTPPIIRAHETRQLLHSQSPLLTSSPSKHPPSALLDRQTGSSSARITDGFGYSCDIEAALAGMVPDDENEDTKQRKGRKGSAMFSSRVVVPIANRARIKGATDYARQPRPRVTQRDGRAMAFLMDFESLEHFWVLLDVSSKLRSFFVSPELEPITTDNVCAGQPCMARSHTSQNDWDRGRIVFVDQLRGFVNVRLVDSGQLLEYIRIDDVKSLSNVDAKVPPVAYRCHLSRPDLEPVIEAYTTAMKKTAGGRPLPPILTKDAQIEVEFDLQAEPRLAENEQEDWPVVNIWYNKRELRTILIEAEAEQQLRIAACQPPPRPPPAPSSSNTVAQICPSVVIGKPTITRLSKMAVRPQRRVIVPEVRRHDRRESRSGRESGGGALPPSIIPLQPTRVATTTDADESRRRTANADTAVTENDDQDLLRALEESQRCFQYEERQRLIQAQLWKSNERQLESDEPLQYSTVELIELPTSSVDAEIPVVGDLLQFNVDDGRDDGGVDSGFNSAAAQDSNLPSVGGTPDGADATARLAL